MRDVRARVSHEGASDVFSMSIPVSEINSFGVSPCLAIPQQKLGYPAPDLVL